MSFIKFLGGLHYVVIAVVALYGGLRFPGGKIIRCSEMLACTDPEGAIANDFDQSLCKTDKYCSGRSGQVRSQEDYEAYNLNQALIIFCFLSIGVRLVIRRTLNDKSSGANKA